MVVGNGWCCLFGFLFEISFRCERELNAKPRVRTNPMAVLRLLVWLWLWVDFYYKKAPQKCKAVNIAWKANFFSKKEMMFQTLKKPCQKKSQPNFCFTISSNMKPRRTFRSSSTKINQTFGGLGTAVLFRAVIKYERALMAVLLFPDFCYLQNQKKKKKKSAFFFPWYLPQDSNFDATE